MLSTDLSNRFMCSRTALSLFKHKIWILLQGRSGRDWKRQPEWRFEWQTRASLELRMLRRSLSQKHPISGGEFHEHSSILRLEGQGFVITLFRTSLNERPSPLCSFPTCRLSWTVPKTPIRASASVDDFFLVTFLVASLPLNAPSLFQYFLSPHRVSEEEEKDQVYHRLRGFHSLNTHHCYH